MALRVRINTLRRFLLRNLVPEIYWPKKVSIDGVKIQVRGEPYSFGVKRCLSKGDYEVPERLLLQKFIRMGMQVLEMGGSIGIISAIVLDRIGSNGRLVSIEADANLARFSATWLETSGQAKVLTGFAFPVWELSSTVGVSSFETVGGSLGGTVSLAQTTQGASREHIWDIKRVCLETGLEPDTLICDIEGSEGVLLDTTLNWPTSIVNLLIEIHPLKLPNGDVDVLSVCKRIEMEGFELRETIGMSYWFSRKQ